MDKTTIGFNAGIVWRSLDDHRKESYAELKEKCRLSDAELYAAIGWLAREDKIVIEENVLTKEDSYSLPYYNYF